MAAQQAGSVKGVVDMIFLVDSTGSMESFIDALKTGISTFINTLTTSDPQNPRPIRDWRGKVVGYRDVRADGADWLVNPPFVTDTASLQAQLGALDAKGGGDQPESLLDALWVLAGSGQGDAGQPEPFRWRHSSEAARVIIAFADTAPHATLHLPEAAGGGVDDVKMQLVNNRIRTILYAPDGDVFAELGGARGVVHEPIEDLTEFSRNTEAFTEALKALAKTVSVIPEPPAL